MSAKSPDELHLLDARHVWHPYTSSPPPLAPWLVERAEGVHLVLSDGRTLIDGMSSWWAAIHGYRHPALDAAVTAQLGRMAHVMFGGLTHAPAIELAERLVKLAPAGLEHVFFSDSGSVAVEVSIKLALQYWQARGRPAKRRLLTVRSGYHGDTFAAMSVCDPETGMHGLFRGNLAEQLFAPAPRIGFGEPWDEADLAELRLHLERSAGDLAAVILEPVVQGAGGMRFYSPRYLERLRQLTREHDVLWIADEIATGFGRTGKLFACEHAGVSPDLLCVGKALTGGYLSLAATLATPGIAEALRSAPPHALMHGPTFMGNPLASAVANANLELLAEGRWPTQVRHIETWLREELADARALPGVRDVRVLGAIGVIELEAPVDMAVVQPAFVDRGVWLRPFGRLIYAMPPFITPEAEARSIGRAMVDVVRCHCR